MPVIHTIPVAQGMTREEVGARIQSGWILAGRQSVSVKAEIVTPGAPMSPTGLMDMDVWFLPEAMMPTGHLARELFELYDQKMGDVSTLNTLATRLLGVPIEELAERMRQQIEMLAANTDGLPGPESGPKQDNSPEAPPQ